MSGTNFTKQSSSKLVPINLIGPYSLIRRLTVINKRRLIRMGERIFIGTLKSGIFHSDFPES